MKQKLKLGESPRVLLTAPQRAALKLAMQRGGVLWSGRQNPATRTLNVLAAWGYLEDNGRFTNRSRSQYMLTDTGRALAETLE